MGTLTIFRPNNQTYLSYCFFSAVHSFSHLFQLKKRLLHESCVVVEQFLDFIIQTSCTLIMTVWHQMKRSTWLSSIFLQMRGSRGGSEGFGPPYDLQSLISPILLEMKNQLFFIFVHLHMYSYTSNRINPQETIK